MNVRLRVIKRKKEASAKNGNHRKNCLNKAPYPISYPTMCFYSICFLLS